METTVIKIKNSEPDQCSTRITCSKEYDFTVDYTQNLKAMINMVGYKEIDENINEENFPVSHDLLNKRVHLTGKFFNFNESCFKRHAIKELNKLGFRLATLPELLALSLKFNQDIKRYSHALALGSIRKVPYKDKIDNEIEIQEYSPFSFSMLCPNSDREFELKLDRSNWSILYTASILGIKKFTS